MSGKRKIEVFSAGCSICTESIRQIESLACSLCEIEVLDLHEPVIAERAASLGIRSILAIVVDGVVAACCSGRGPNLDVFQVAGLGVQ